MKDDLIRRSDAIKAIEELPNCYNGWSDTYDKAYIIGTLEEVPTINIVFCKECKYWQKSRERAVMCCLREVPNRPMKADDFCSYGERREP